MITIYNLQFNNFKFNKIIKTFVYYANNRSKPEPEKGEKKTHVPHSKFLNKNENNEKCRNLNEE